MSGDQLAEWIKTLPADVRASDVCSIVHGMPFGAKRAVAFAFKDGSGHGIYIESMGTHLSEARASEMKFLSTL